VCVLPLIPLDLALEHGLALLRDRRRILDRVVVTIIFESAPGSLKATSTTLLLNMYA
jgi:hypothetical protein